MSTEMDEQRVTVAPGVDGAWLRPGGAWDGRVVLFLHGFADDMDAVGDLTKRVAGELAERGVASLRINFRGEGDRARTEVESTLDTRTEDTESAFAFLAAQPGVAVARVGVVGWSLGATTAIVVAARRPTWFRTMVVWASPAGDQWEALGGSEVGQRALRDGAATEDIPGWKKITTKRAFYESFRGVDLDEALGRYPNAFLSVRGSHDDLVAREIEFLNRAPGLPRESVIIGGMDHVFSAFEPENGCSARAVGVTVEWLLRTL